MTDGQFYHLLKGYKGYYATAAQPAQLASLYIRFLQAHGACISQAVGYAWDTITIVPSSGNRAGPHPLEQVATWTASLLGQQYASLLEKGQTTIGHNKADDQGYQTTGNVNGRNLLLIDDTFTSGARVQSAASALQLARARVIAAVVAGRVITPGGSQESQALWDEAGKTLFSFDTCCLEGNTWFS